MWRHTRWEGVSEIWPPVSRTGAGYKKIMKFVWRNLWMAPKGHLRRWLEWKLHYEWNVNLLPPGESWNNAEPTSFCIECIGRGAERNVASETRSGLPTCNPLVQSISQSPCHSCTDYWKDLSRGERLQQSSNYFYSFIIILQY